MTIPLHDDVDRARTHLAAEEYRQVVALLHPHLAGLNPERVAPDVDRIAAAIVYAEVLATAPVDPAALAWARFAHTASRHLHPVGYEQPLRAGAVLARVYDLDRQLDRALALLALALFDDLGRTRVACDGAGAVATVLARVSFASHPPQVPVRAGRRRRRHPGRVWEPQGRTT
jgi:hypothetical protein